MYDALSQDLNDLAKRVVSKICCCRREAARRLSSSHAVDKLGAHPAGPLRQRHPLMTKKAEEHFHA